MRKVLIAFGSIGLLIGGCIALVFTLTAGLPAAADDFFTAAAQGNMKEAYEQTSLGFQETVTLIEMIDYLKYTGLEDYESASWSTRSFENEWGYLEGVVTTSEGQAIPLMMDLIKEQEVWKIYSMELIQSNRP